MRSPNPPSPGAGRGPALHAVDLPAPGDVDRLAVLDRVVDEQAADLKLRNPKWTDVAARHARYFYDRAQSAPERPGLRRLAERWDFHASAGAA